MNLIYSVTFSHDEAHKLRWNKSWTSIAMSLQSELEYSQRAMRTDHQTQETAIRALVAKIV